MSFRLCFRLRRCALVACLLLPACAFHSTATHWHGHVGSDGEPVFVQQSTYVGVNFGVLVPLFGSTTIDEMIGDATANIAHGDGTCLRLVETETNNYWYGVPPLSWIVSPVVTSISIEYRPSAASLARAGVTASAEESSPAAPAR